MTGTLNNILVKRQLEHNCMLEETAETRLHDLFVSKCAQVSN